MDGVGFVDESALLKHEVAYVLGQMRLSEAIPILTRVLENRTEDAMVRHEAAEALGAIGASESVSVLQKYAMGVDEEEVVRQTCELAVAKIQHELQEAQAETETEMVEVEMGGYTTVDPAPAFKQDKSIHELRDILLNTSLPLFERYRAMFSLRNLGTHEAIRTLAQGLKDPSALFRHEIAYVFGQMQHVESVEALKSVLEDEKEVGMVRHECAEALGSIASDACLPVLEKYKNTGDGSTSTSGGSGDVVSESCVVALDMYAYERSHQFHYN